MKDLIFNTESGEIMEIEIAPEDLIIRETARKIWEEQVILDLLIPSAEEIIQAEFELKTIKLLMEVGLLCQ